MSKYYIPLVFQSLCAHVTEGDWRSNCVNINRSKDIGKEIQRVKLRGKNTNGKKEPRIKSKKGRGKEVKGLSEAPSFRTSNFLFGFRSVS